jgi:acyl carrier protein
MSVKNKLLAVLEVYYDESVALDTPILNSSGTDNVEMVMLLEDEFALEIPDEDAAKLVTVQDVVKYLDEKKKPTEPPKEEKE